MFSLFKRWYHRHFSQPGTIEFALVLLGVFLTIYYFMWLVGPLVVALCLAFCLDWPVEVLEQKWHIKRRFGSSIIMILFCSLAISITLLIVPQVIKQGAEFYNSIVAFSTDAYDNKARIIEKTIAKDHNSTFESSIDTVNHPLQQKSEVVSSTINTQIIEKEGATIVNQGAEKNKLPTLTQTTEEKSLLNNNLKNLETNTSSISEQNLNQEELLTNTEALVQKALNTSTSNKKELDQKIEQIQISTSAGTNTLTIKNQEDDKPLQIQRFRDYDAGFTLTVGDFDRLIAHDLYRMVENLPEPIPSIMTISTIEQGVRSLRVQSTNRIATFFREQLMPSVVNAFTWLVYIIIVPIFTFLMLYNKHELQNRAKTFLLPNNQMLMLEFWPSLHQQIGGYIRGKIVHILLMTVINSIAFKLLGVNYALLLGVGVGLSVVIPYVGAVIIAVPVVFVAIFQFGFSTELLWVLAVYTAIQLLDSNVLTPMLFSKAMNLDAFSILAAILIFGGLWGFWGVFFAIPLATIIKTLLVRWPNKDIMPQETKTQENSTTLETDKQIKQQNTEEKNENTAKHSSNTCLKSAQEKLDTPD